jgi:type IV secretory pathway protease TraF
MEHPLRPGFEMVKRVTGLPGDQVDGVVLGPDQYWVVGDRSVESTDSRTFGPVSAALFRGTIWLRYWPPGRLRLFAGDERAGSVDGQ